MEEVSGRKKYLPEKRAEIMKQHLLEKKALSEVCDANGIHPTMVTIQRKYFKIRLTGYL